MKIDELRILLSECFFYRAFEDEISRLAQRGETPGLVHLSRGAEVFEAALMTALDLSVDHMTGSHRSHVLALASGADPVAVAGEILGRNCGLSGGVAGTQHLLSYDTGFLCSNGIVGAQVPIAAGAALSAKINKTGGIGVAVMGDGATNQGAVLETMNMAVSLDLPLFFIVENNGFAQSTTTSNAGGAVSVVARARGFGLVADQTDGSEVRAFYPVLMRLIDYVRSQQKPAFLEVSVPRLGGHYEGDGEIYRTQTPLIDPLDLLSDLADQAEIEGISDIQSMAEHKALSAIQTALKSPKAEPNAKS